MLVRLSHMCAVLLADETLDTSIVAGSFRNNHPECHTIVDSKRRGDFSLLAKLEGEKFKVVYISSSWTSQLVL